MTNDERDRLKRMEQYQSKPKRCLTQKEWMRFAFQDKIHNSLWDVNLENKASPFNYFYFFPLHRLTITSSVTAWQISKQLTSPLYCYATFFRRSLWIRLSSSHPLEIGRWNFRRFALRVCLYKSFSRRCWMRFDDEVGDTFLHLKNKTRNHLLLTLQTAYFCKKRSDMLGLTNWNILPLPRSVAYFPLKTSCKNRGTRDLKTWHTFRNEFRIPDDNPKDQCASEQELAHNSLHVPGEIIKASENCQDAERF